MRALHLVGSPTDETFADLARPSAADCLAATASAGVEPVVAWVSPDGSWRFPAGLGRAEIAAAPGLSVAEAVARIARLGVDVAVPQMFCRPGMTAYRSLLDVLGIPYVGNTAEVMALGADKAKAKAVVAAAGVAVAAGEVLGRGDRPSLRPPAVVKPVDSDNSWGVGLVRDDAGWDAALAAAFAHSDRVLVEEYVPLGREVRCGSVVLDGELHPLPLEEYDVDTDRKPVRDETDKLGRGADGELALQAKDGARAWIVDVDDPVTPAVWAAARWCHAALGCRDYGLFDFRVDPAGRPVFLEAGLYCSYARQSVIPTMAAAAGIALPDLFRAHIEQAVARGG